jgi:hypothetical protein
MGASSWEYFVPYQEDIEQALQDLRWQVFREGKFNNYAKEDLDGWLAYETEERRRAFADMQERLCSFEMADPLPFETIEDYIAFLTNALTSPDAILNADFSGEGTWSIIDIQHVGTDPEEYFIVFPLPAQALMEYFGTEQPTRQHFEAYQRQHGRPGAIGHGKYYWCQRGIYIIVFKGGQPDEIFFDGCSGD